MSVNDSTARRYELLDPDVRLMLEVRDGSATAFEKLVERYQVRLLSILSHLVRNRGMAEDLAQEVFLRVYRARERYQPNAKFATWLFTIANNVASNAMRSAAYRREINLVADSGGNTSPLERLALDASGQMPTRQLDKAERAEVVRVAMQSLNDRQRMALLLSKFEGMSYAEIADAMDTSEKAVKSLVARARERLKDFLQPYVSDGTPPPEIPT